MKKPLLTVLAAALAVLLPMESLNAQGKPIKLNIKTLDHALVTSATIYAGQSGTNYYVDAANFNSLILMIIILKSYLIFIYLALI